MSVLVSICSSYTFRYKITSSMLRPYVIDEGSLALIASEFANLKPEITV